MAGRPDVGLLLALIVGLVAVQPSPAVASGTATGGAPMCQKVGVLQVDLSGTPRPIGGLASAQCVIPEGLPGTRWGPGVGRGANPPDGGGVAGDHVAGGACSYRRWVPVDVYWQGGDLWVSWVNDLAGDRISMPTGDNQRWLDSFSRQDGWMPMQFQGKWDQSGQFGLANCLPDTAPGANTGTGVLCGFDNIQAVAPFPGCMQMTDPGVLRSPGGLDAGAVRSRLTGLVRGFQALIQPGQISSFPNNPNPGLTQVGTCFFVTGMNIPNDQWYEVVLDGGDVGEGRHIFYTFAVHVSYVSTSWDFGDGSQQPDPGLPTQCDGAGGQAQVSVAHTYKHYSVGAMPGDTFPVRATESYRVDVWELWVDPPTGAVQSSFFPDAVPPITPSVGPYPKGVVQEEPVPLAPTS